MPETQREIIYGSCFQKGRKLNFILQGPSGKQANQGCLETPFR